MGLAKIEAAIHLAHPASSDVGTARRKFFTNVSLHGTRTLFSDMAVAVVVTIIAPAMLPQLLLAVIVHCQPTLVSWNGPALPDNITKFSRTFVAVGRRINDQCPSVTRSTAAVYRRDRRAASSPKAAP
jgi:hypothetical protein